MATYHLTVKHGKVGTGRKHAEYILREGSYSKGSKVEELIYAEANNFPSWCDNPIDFFAAADNFERINGTVYTEIELALPNEFNLDENKKLIAEFIAKNIGSNKFYTYAIHMKTAAFAENVNQPHAHIMFCEREMPIDLETTLPPEQFFKRYNPKYPDRGGYRKDPRFVSKNGLGAYYIKEIRADWELRVNSYYEARNLDVKVSSRSLKSQKTEAVNSGNYLLAEFLDRPAQVHLGPKLANNAKKIIMKNGLNRDTIKELPEKAIYVILAKIEKSEREEIYKYQKFMQMTNGTKSKMQDNFSAILEEVQPIKVALDKNGLIHVLDKVCEEIRNSNEAVLNEILKRRKIVMSDKRIMDMALSIYTHGESKAVAKQIKSLNKMQRKLEAAINEFNKKREPAFYQVQLKQEYKAEQEKLIKWKNDYSKLEAELSIKAQKISIVMTTEPHKTKIQAIVDKLKHRNNQRKLQLKDLTAIARDYQKMYNKAFDLRWKLKDGRYFIDKAKLELLSKPKTISDFNSGLNEIEMLLKKMIHNKPKEGTADMSIAFHEENNVISSELGI